MMIDFKQNTNTHCPFSLTVMASSNDDFCTSSYWLSGWLITWLCLLKVLTLMRMKESMFLMGKEQKLLSSHRRTRHSLLVTPAPLLPTPRTSSAPLSLHPPPPSRISGLVTPSPPPPVTPRSFSHLPLSIHLHLLFLLWQSLIWSAAYRRSGGFRTRAWTRVSFVSPGQRTVASFTVELDTWCPATSVPGSWRRGTSCVLCAGSLSSLLSSPTSAETSCLSSPSFGPHLPQLSHPVCPHLDPTFKQQKHVWQSSVWPQLASLMWDSCQVHLWWDSNSQFTSTFFTVIFNLHWIIVK